MAYSSMAQDLKASLSVLESFSPYPGHTTRASWQEAMDLAGDVHAQLDLIETYRPGLLHQLSNDCYDEQQVQERPMIKEVRELIRRYARSR